MRFIQGNVYFIVTFEDQNLSVPLIQTLIFNRVGKRSDGSTYFLFKQLQPDIPVSTVIVDEVDADGMVLDGDGLIDILQGCFSGQLAFMPSRKPE